LGRRIIPNITGIIAGRLILCAEKRPANDCEELHNK
jgi:hypothetical protein